MSQELKNRTKKFALDVIGLCAGLPHLPETRHAIDQLIRSSSSVAANYRSACRGKSKADFIAKLGIVEEEADESGFWLEMLRDVCELLSANSGTANSSFTQSLTDGNSAFKTRPSNFTRTSASARRDRPACCNHSGIAENSTRNVTTIRSFVCRSKT